MQKITANKQVLMFSDVKKAYYLLFILLAILTACHSQKVCTSKKEFKPKTQDKNTYANWKEAASNNDFSTARDFPLSVSENLLLKVYEALLNHDSMEAEKISSEMRPVDSINYKKALSVIFNYYFYHTKWDAFIKFIESTGSFPDGYESVIDYQNFPQEEIIFPLNDSVFVPIKKFNYGNTPIIEVQINGKKKHFIIDTGVSISAVSSEIAKECNIIKGLNSIDVRDANNVTKKNNAYPAYIGELKLNNLKVFNHPIFVSDNLKFKIMGITVYKIDGIIGWNLLQKLKVSIDYENHNILFCKSKKHKNKRKILHGIKSPFITTTSTNGNTLLFHFDTGANSISLSENAKNKLIVNSNKQKTSISFGVNKNRKVKQDIIKDFDIFIGNYKFNISEVSFNEVELSSGELILLDGRIGNNPFLNGKITFDYQNGLFEYSEKK